MIGFNRTTIFTEGERLADPEGRYFFIKGKLFDMTCTIANIYSPNRNPDKFLKRALYKLERFKEGKLIVAGDLNYSMDPRCDISGDVPRSTTEKWEDLKRTLRGLQLMDAWRVCHPKKRDYTFYSPVHKSFSRIDYILIEHQFFRISRISRN